jgi:hypothetical protein
MMIVAGDEARILASPQRVREKKHRVKVIEPVAEADELGGERVEVESIKGEHRVAPCTRCGPMRRGC